MFPVGLNMRHPARKDIYNTVNLHLSATVTWEKFYFVYASDWIRWAAKDESACITLERATPASSENC
jgi:hypothetical protein